MLKKLLACLLLSGMCHALEYDRTRGVLAVGYENRTHEPVELTFCINAGCMKAELDPYKEGGIIRMPDPAQKIWINRVVLRPSGSWFSLTAPSPVYCLFSDTQTERHDLWEGSFDVRDYYALWKRSIIIEKASDSSSCRVRIE